MSKDRDQIIRQFLAEIGRKGGKARAKKHDKATLSKWAKKGGSTQEKGRRAMIYKRGKRGIYSYRSDLQFA